MSNWTASGCTADFVAVRRPGTKGRFGETPNSPGDAEKAGQLEVYV
jgi:hypothetical protein